MSKPKVGDHQINRIYPSNNMLNLSDHDFPVSSYWLSVSGYMLFENKNNSCEVTDLINTYDLHRDVSRIGDGT